MIDNLFHAIYNEHLQRTGHDIFKIDRFNPVWMYCNVCLYLDAEKRIHEQVEREYYEKGNEDDC